MQTYIREDNQVVQRWLVAREAGKPARQDWSYTVAEQGAAVRLSIENMTTTLMRLFRGEASPIQPSQP